MKNLILITFLTAISISCVKDEFDTGNPDVIKFVEQIRSGSYNCYETGENGDKLWLLMPEFREEHIRFLLDLSKDTTHISDYPANPISSRRPYPEGRTYLVLGECLLWTVEGIRNGSGYGSLDPYLIDSSKMETELHNGLKGIEILVVRDLYIDWWNANRNSDWKNMNPLEGTSYIWF